MRNPVVDKTDTSIFLNYHKEEAMALQPLLDEVEQLKAEYEKFERGNKSAGTRARKCLQNVKKLAQDLRVEIQQAKGAS